ncbi:hypothetical protein VTJ04DRAFT_10310 [Mycothermus thermophilus]|uniref:uncharacterized protein n=1 Tax=Humicola insolens TaxID=85995 RepID=UPI0037435BCA
MIVTNLVGVLLLASTGASRSITRRACGFSVPAEAGDTCASIAEFWGITEAEFIAWNPSVGAGCSAGVVPGLEYCIEWIGPITTTTSSSSSTSTTTTTARTTSTTSTSAGPSPTQDGLISTCTKFHKVVSGDTCQKIVDKYGTFSLRDFYTWNPAVGTECSYLMLDYYVCVGIPGTPTTRPTTSTSSTITTTSVPTQSGITRDCTTFYQVVSGDTCQKIVDKYGTFTLSNFYSWNPAVGSDCSGLQPGVYVCVGVRGTPTTRPTSTLPSPTQTGLVSNCRDFYKVVQGDTCQKIVDKYKTFTLNDFYKWNPAVGTSCTNLQVGVYVCVGIPSTPTKPITTSTARTTSTSTRKTSTSTRTTTTTSSAPSPTQPGIISTCNKYYKVKSGDTCDKIRAAHNNSFTLQQFYSWNSGVGNGCTTLWVGYYVCVGVRK